MLIVFQTDSHARICGLCWLFFRLSHVRICGLCWLFFRLTVMPGFVTAIAKHESETLLCADISHKIIRSDTLLDMMYNLYNQNRGDSFYDDCVRQFVGSIVLTRWVNWYSVLAFELSMHHWSTHVLHSPLCWLHTCIVLTLVWSWHLYCPQCPDTCIVLTLVWSWHLYCPDTCIVPTLVLSRHLYCPDTCIVPTLVLSRHLYCPDTCIVPTLVLSSVSWHLYCPDTCIVLSVLTLVLSRHLYCPHTVHHLLLG
jgi:hypothetical protein